MARYKDYMRDRAYRIYVSDSLNLAPQNKYRTDRYADIFQVVNKDTRSGDEIASDVISRLGLRFNECI